MSILKLGPLVTLLLLVFAPHVSAQEGEHHRTNARVNVRACPERSCEVLYTYPMHAPLSVVARVEGQAINDNANWLEIRDEISGQRAYLHATLAETYQPAPWQTLPIVPTVTDTARDIYQRGLSMGNQPDAFAKVGDCQNVSSYFLAVYDVPGEYRLGEFDHLQSTIDHFNGSWSRESVAVDNGFNVASVLSPLWNDPERCDADETPLACEQRLHQPSIVLISMETWWGGRDSGDYEAYLSQIVEFWIERGVVPILGTKADNLEGDHQLNAAVARVAQRYDVPLWNFWRAVQTLPGYGLTTDDFHLTFARNFFDDPNRLRYGWPVRNLTALQALDAVYRGLQG